MTGGFKSDGKQYTPAVLLVTERDHLGRPATARFVHEEQTIDLRELAADGKVPECIIVYVCKDTWGPAPDG